MHHTLKRKTTNAQYKPTTKKSSAHRINQVQKRRSVSVLVTGRKDPWFQILCLSSCYRLRLANTGWACQVTRNLTPVINQKDTLKILCHRWLIREGITALKSLLILAKGDIEEVNDDTVASSCITAEACCWFNSSRQVFSCEHTEASSSFLLCLIKAAVLRESERLYPGLLSCSQSMHKVHVSLMCWPMHILYYVMQCLASAAHAKKRC